METAAMGAAMTAVGMLATAPDIGADRVAFTITVSVAMTTAGAAASSASTTRTAWRFGRGVVHIVHLPPLLEEAHAPHSQFEEEERKTMMGGLWVLVVKVVCGVVHAGCLCAASPCCFVGCTRINALKIWQTTAY
jgi:hypothetical protein